MVFRKAIAAAAIAALVLTACTPSVGGGAGEEGDGTGDVKMVLWPGPEGEAMQKVVDGYNAGPGAEEKIKVEMVLLSRQDTFSKEATQMAAKSSEQDIYFGSRLRSNR